MSAAAERRAIARLVTQARQAKIIVAPELERGPACEVCGGESAVCRNEPDGVKVWLCGPCAWPVALARPRDPWWLRALRWLVRL